MRRYFHRGRHCLPLFGRKFSLRVTDIRWALFAEQNPYWVVTR